MAPETMTHVPEDLDAILTTAEVTVYLIVPLQTESPAKLIHALFPDLMDVTSELSAFQIIVEDVPAISTIHKLEKKFATNAQMLNVALLQ
jgi:hypothetical protein